MDSGSAPKFWHLLLVRVFLLLVAALFLALLWRDGGWMVRIAGVVLASGLVVMYWGGGGESDAEHG
jgi:hypothetical protein